MTTLNDILREVKDVPPSRLDELFSFVKSLTIQHQSSEGSARNKIMSFSGSFSDMKSNDYADFLNHLKQSREQFIDRKYDL